MEILITLILITLLALIVAGFVIDFVVKAVMGKKYKIIYSVIAFIIIVPLVFIWLLLGLFEMFRDVHFMER